jgi:hypothetical protein
MLSRGSGLALAGALSLALAACPRSSGHGAHPPGPPPTPRAGSFTLTILGTNDLHGAIDRLPILAGYVANLRAVRAADGGQVLLLDAGDMFQGTLGSNLGEGAAVVAAYNAIGYDAAAIGNHEFDFGPVGPAVTASGPDDDPRGALRARALEANFPFLSANVLDAADRQAPGVEQRAGLGDDREGAGGGRGHRRDHRGDAVHDDAGQLPRPGHGQAGAGDRRRGHRAAQARRAGRSSSPPTSARSAATSTTPPICRRAIARRSCSR